MSLQLRLDSAALAALFPEGSTARVELQSAVIAEFVSKHIKQSALGPNVMSEIEKAKREAVEESLKKLGLTRGAWGSIKLDGEIKNEIFNQTKVAIAAEVREHIATAVGAAIATVSHDAQAAINRLVDTEIRTAVKARVAGVVAQLDKGV